MSMVQRTASSRRRRASRSAATSPHRGPGRRPSMVATSEDHTELPRSRQRRASIAVPEDTSPTEFVTITAAEDDDHESEPEIEVYNRSPRGSLVPDYNKSPRGSLTPDAFNRSSRNSLVPEYNRSPRNSIIPDTRGSRNNLLPEPLSYSRSPRGSFSGGCDTENFIRSRTIEEFNKSSGNTLVPEYSRSARNSLVPDTSPSRSSRNILLPDTSPSRSPRGSIAPDPSRSPRGSIAPDPSRSPRGSLVPEINRSPRGSLIPESNRSPRGSIASETSHNRSPRNSLPLQESPSVRSPRGSIGSASLHDARGTIDIISAGRVGRSPSPYKTQKAQNYTTQDSTGSRRASSSVSQVSGDEKKHLCEHTELNSESGGIAAYGSVVYQLNHANMEASSTCDFLIRALGIVYRTVFVTVVLICLTTLPLVMFIFGLQFVRDCPKEPHIPVYMIVGGTFGTLKMIWLVWQQVRSRGFEKRRERNSAVSNSLSTPSRLVDITLTAFLFIWFVFGNMWILSIYWPEFEPTLFEPNRWCHRTLYVFSLAHLAILYSVIAMVIITIIVLLACQLCNCHLLSYK